MIGERTNVAGSPRFPKNRSRKASLEDALAVARQQVENGAPVIDVCFDDGMIDGVAMMTRFLNLIQSEPDIAKVPIMVDSSKWEIIEAGLKCLQGKGIVNSISLKEGEEVLQGMRPHHHEIRRRCRRHGLRRKRPGRHLRRQDPHLRARLPHPRRMKSASTRRTSSSTPTSSPSPPASRSTTTTPSISSSATKWIKENLPGAKVSGGVSNVSFSFRGNNPVREAMHAAFLYHAGESRHGHGHRQRRDARSL